ncbi:MAG TPA: 4-hydroxy-tetrahydrodipicolinate reductase [Deltaproteobacteria bacterium]|nr:4-hydroxy-tetrahydrodipicolinate reductase [Deltaproteobacteria bacterium]HOM29342.1 4-hydroxy-tetrahydrodipicolinate reductase [Deltaproteobacteria bacterium]HPP80326.1 4-hydroxy-tetrahydrodipicolinate reductase [Deltaproteobacteria bacterium]
MTRIGVVGIGGRMGSAVGRLVLAERDLELAGALEAPSHPFVGRDAGEVLGVGAVGVRVSGQVDEAFGPCDCIVDFSLPAVTLGVARYASGARKAMVIGTTGFTDEEKRVLEACAQRVPIVLSPNMSVGVNVLLRVVEELGRVLDDTYDAEIVEAHHRMKKDAPSGTALALAQALAQGRGVELSQRARFSRQGIIGERPVGEIGIQTVRAGDIVGDHTVIFAGPGERIEITHRAHTRENFARGAVRAALWITSRPAGLYTMKDVLGFEHGRR